MNRISLVTLALLAGCAPGRTIAQQCGDMGYEPGTALYLECYQGKERMAWQRASHPPTFMQQPFPNYQPYMMQTRTRRTTNCTNYGGGFVSCTSD